VGKLTLRQFPLPLEMLENHLRVLLSAILLAAFQT
jgi:hypothetical protein